MFMAAGLQSLVVDMLLILLGTHESGLHTNACCGCSNYLKLAVWVCGTGPVFHTPACVNIQGSM